jgi:hypothetical protein
VVTSFIALESPGQQVLLPSTGLGVSRVIHPKQNSSFGELRGVDFLDPFVERGVVEKRKRRIFREFLVFEDEGVPSDCRWYGGGGIFNYLAD